MDERQIPLRVCAHAILFEISACRIYIPGQNLAQGVYTSQMLS